MKKIYTLAVLLYFTGVLTARAQDTTTCNPGFSIVSTSGHTANFAAWDIHPGTVQSWGFGDGSFLTNYSSTASHTYASPGYYTVKHVIWDSFGAPCHDSSTQTVYIDSMPAPPACQIYLALHVDSSVVPNHYIFWAGPRSAGDSLSWYVNDSLFVRNDTGFNHDFGPGYYTVCVRLHTLSGCTTSSCYSFGVHTADSSSDTTHTPPPPPPYDTCSVSFSYTVHGGLVQFIAHDSSGLDSLTWVITSGRDTAFMYGHTPVYNFMDTGCYNVLLLSVTPNGCRNTTWQTVCIDSLGGGGFITSYPNPAPGVSNIDLKLDQDNQVYINIFNSMGHLVLSKRVSAIKGMNHIALPTAELPKGIYYVQIRYGNVTKRSKIQKL